MKGSILLGYVASAYCHRRGYAQAVAWLTGAQTKVTLQLSPGAAHDELLQRA
ncbi:hypothetical protein [Nocardia sp. NRRL S-836]|uniref:hypothetical protein n=1 Tax=Nocardia sp. NRRL S-836 TaxID=1519492 RepID=UPI000B268D41|nr:hypothetical protein [Nocardia sp. NRRL S-836]